MFNFFKLFRKEKGKDLSFIKREELSLLVKLHDERLRSQMEYKNHVLSQKIKNTEMIKNFIIDELNDKTDGDHFKVEMKIVEKTRDWLQDSESLVVIHLTLPVGFQRIYYPLSKVVSFHMDDFYYDKNDSKYVINSMVTVISTIKHFYKERKINALHT